MCVGDLIRQKRQELNLSQEELGRMVGVNRAAINKWECGRVKNLKRETIKKLSEIFNISPALLVEPEYPVQTTDMIDVDIGSIIHNRRNELGLTMKQVADAIGVSEATVSRWESGEISDMRRSKIASLSKILNISPLDIIGWEYCSPAPVESLTAHEKAVITAYRAKPEMQMAVDTLLGVSSAPTIESDIGRTVAMGESVLGKSRTDTK